MKVYFYALFFHLTLNIYVFWRGWQILRSKKGFRAFYAGLFGIEFLVYLAGLLLQNRFPDNVTHFVAFLGTSWMLFVLYMTMGLVVIDLAFIIHRRKAFLPQKLHQNPRRTKGTVFIATFFFVIGLMIQGNYKFNHPVVEHQRIVVQKEAKNMDSLRIVMAGDWHLGYLIDKSYAEKYVELINAQRPDIILLVGDIIDAGIKPMKTERMDEELRRLHAPLGVYSCTGNHEYRYEAEEKINWLNNVAGITLLRDSAVLIDSAFYLIGREDRNAPVRKPLQQIIREQRVNTALPMIVLDHNPIDLDDDAFSHVDLALYGHTHRGQFFPANFLSDLLFEVSHGYKKKDDTNVFVTSGLGLAGPQYRIGTQSEIVVLEVIFE